MISIHALLAESDHPKMSDHPHNTNFYPRSPCGERPYGALKHVHVHAISIHALLAESDYSGKDDRQKRARISIHALLAESDVPQQENGQAATISIHALLAESDTPRLARVVPTPIFLSTLSLRRATIKICHSAPP